MPSDDDFYGTGSTRNELLTRFGLPLPKEDTLVDVVATWRDRPRTADQQLVHDRAALWWAGLKRWEQLAWSEALFTYPPHTVSSISYRTLKGMLSEGEPATWSHWHALAYSFARHSVVHEQYSALRAAVARVLDAKEASGERRAHPLVRTQPQSPRVEYLWGDDWRPLGTTTISPDAMFTRVARLMASDSGGV